MTLGATRLRREAEAAARTHRPLQRPHAQPGGFSMRLVSPRLWIIALAAIGLGLSAQPAKANWVFSSGDLSASADFTVVGSTLTVTLKNTASVSPNDPAGVLSALFFNYSGPGSISFTPLGMG